MTDDKDRDPSECADYVATEGNPVETTKVPFDALPWSWAVEDGEGNPSARAERQMLWLHIHAATDAPLSIKTLEYIEASRRFFSHGLLRDVKGKTDEAK